MAGFSNHLAQALVNATLRATAYSSPAVANLYLALFTADPTDANVTANEVSAAWYTRITTGTWAAPSGGVSSNLSTITFPAVTSASVTVTHIGIYDASTGGNLLYSQAMSASKTLAVNDVLVFAIGDIDIDLQ